MGDLSRWWGAPGGSPQSQVPGLAQPPVSSLSLHPPCSKGGASGRRAGSHGHAPSSTSRLWPWASGEARRGCRALCHEQGAGLSGHAAWLHRRPPVPADVEGPAGSPAGVSSPSCRASSPVSATPGRGARGPHARQTQGWRPGHCAWHTASLRQLRPPEETGLGKGKGLEMRKVTPFFSSTGDSVWPVGHCWF